MSHAAPLSACVAGGARHSPAGSRSSLLSSTVSRRVRVDDSGPVSRLVWVCPERGCGVGNRLGGMFCRGCGTRRASEPVSDGASRGIEGLAGGSSGPAMAAGPVRISGAGAVLRLDALDDVLLVRSEHGDYLVPFASFASAAARGYELSRPETNSVVDRARRRWTPVCSHPDAFYVACGSELLRLDRRRLTSLGEPVPEDRPQDIVGLVRTCRCPGPILALGRFDRAAEAPWVVCAVGATLQVFTVDNGLPGPPRLTLPVQAGTNWVGFAREIHAYGGAVLLGLSDPDDRQSARIRAAASMRWAPAGPVIEERELSEELQTAQIVASRPASMIQTRLLAEVSLGQSPVVVALSVPDEVAKAKAVPLRDGHGHKVLQGADLGAVKSGVYRAIAVGSAHGVGFAESDALTHGESWPMPTSWEARQPRFAAQGSLFAGIVGGAGDQSHCVVADLTRGPHSCDVRSCLLPGGGRPVEMVCLQHDVLWAVSLDHTDLAVRWFNLGALFNTSSPQETGQ